MKRFTLILLLLLPTPLFAMGDDALFHSGMVDIDYGRVDGQSVITWDGNFRIGGDYDKLVLRSRGDRTSGTGSLFGHNELQMLWSHYIAPFWDIRAGFRRDWKPFRRNEGVIALAGMAPYYIDTNIALYIGKGGETRGEIELAHDLQLTQNWVAELYADSEWNGFNDRARQIGSGVAQFNVGSRVRYEFNRHIAIYADLYVDQAMGRTRDILQSAGEKTRDSGVRAGIRLFNL